LNQTPVSKNNILSSGKKLTQTQIKSYDDYSVENDVINDFK